MALIAGADPGNQYLVPWAYGTDGLGFNVTKVRAILGKDVDLANWDLLFKPEYAAKLKSCGISMLDQGSEIFPNVLKYMGKNPDSVNPADYQEAFELLKKIRPYIGQFNSSGYINDLAGGDICMAFGWSGDVTIAKHRAKEAGKSYEIGYFIPHQAPASGLTPWRFRKTPRIRKPRSNGLTTSKPRKCMPQLPTRCSIPTPTSKAKKSM